LLDLDGCVAAMEEALASLQRGEVHMPLRPVVRPPGETHLLGLMPVYRGGKRPLYALKTVAVMNASPVTAVRTAAVTAVATRLLARGDARELAIVGAGVQARSHLRALPGFERVRVASRTCEHAQALAAEAGAVACASVEEAVRGADVVVVATSAPEPVLRREWLKEGAHVNAVGMGRELDDATLREGTLVVDRRESAEVEGKIDGAWIDAELGEIVVGQRPGRTSPKELTVFRSLGVAVEDLFAAEYLVRRARETGRGETVEF